MDENVTIHENIYLSGNYSLVGIVYLKKNGCCQNRPVLITKSKMGAISTQCACGGWCSNGHRTATAAVKEYEHMSEGNGLLEPSKVSVPLKRFEDTILNFETWVMSRDI